MHINRYFVSQTLQIFCITLNMIRNPCRHATYFLPLPKAAVDGESEQGHDQEQAYHVLGGHL